MKAVRCSTKQNNLFYAQSAITVISGRSSPRALLLLTVVDEVFLQQLGTSGGLDFVVWI